MTLRIFPALIMVAVSCGTLPGRAADSAILKLVMPDAKVVAGVNVDLAKNSTFGQYVLSQFAGQNQQSQELTASIGIDPARDIHELLVASGAAGGHAGLVFARGVFDPARIAAAAAAKGAGAETYRGVTILSDAKKTGGLAFPDSTLAIMGDLANVRAAIDRLSSPAAPPPALLAQVADWSGTTDAWLVSAAPPSALMPQGAAPAGIAAQNPALYQSVQQFAVGVKFGANVQINARAQTDTAQNATSLVAVLQFMANLAQAQAQRNPAADATLKSLLVTADSNIVNLSLTLPEDQAEQLFKSRAAAPRQNKN